MEDDQMQTSKHGIFLAGLVPVLIGVLNIVPASANYMYNVDFLLPGYTVTGTIVTDCDSCTLTGSDFVSWNFNRDGSQVNLTNSNSQLVAINSPLVATPQAITDEPAVYAGHFNFFEFDGPNLSILYFDAFANCPSSFAGGLCPVSIGYLGGNEVPDGNNQLYTDNPIQIATIYVPAGGTPSPTPLPPTLPLFASALSGLALLGWRRNRKPKAI
jgi:hypothetical protein